MDDAIARYRAALDRTRHTDLTAEQILIILDIYLDRNRENFAAFVALQGLRSAITGGMDFAALLAFMGEEEPHDNP